MNIVIKGGVGVEITRKMRHRMQNNAAWELLAALLQHRERRMYIHNEIQMAVLPLLKKYNLEIIDLIGELNHAAWELSVLTKDGIDKLEAKLLVQLESEKPT